MKKVSKEKKREKQRNRGKHGPQARLVQSPALWRRKQKAESRTLSYNFLLFPLLFKAYWLFDLWQRGTVAIFLTPEACLYIPLLELNFTVSGKRNYWLIFKTTCKQNSKLSHHCSPNFSFWGSLYFFTFSRIMLSQWMHCYLTFKCQNPFEWHYCELWSHTPHVNG